MLNKDSLISNYELIRREEFPQLDRWKRIYLDSTATSQEPISVRKAAFDLFTTFPRGSNHSENSEEAVRMDDMVKKARGKIRAFFGAGSFELTFTSGTTRSSNDLALRFPFKKGDHLIMTEMEHNSQIVTARNVARKAGAKVHFIPFDENGRLDLDKLDNVVSKIYWGRILMNLVHVSNFTGLINPVDKVRTILGREPFLYLDMAQSGGHIPINLDQLNVDFASTSSHKMYGPMGMGALFMNERGDEILNKDIAGGGAVKFVSKYFTALEKAPAVYEPGTQDLEGIVEWGLAIDFLQKIGMSAIHKHDVALAQHLDAELRKNPKLNIYAPEDFKDRTSIVTFNIGHFRKKNYDEVARMLNKKGISVRDGCFCAHIYGARMIGLPRWVHETRALMYLLGIDGHKLKVPGAVRASIAFYNTPEDIERMIVAVNEIAEEI